jgi:hypothetical protein
MTIVSPGTKDTPFQLRAIVVGVDVRVINEVLIVEEKKYADRGRFVPLVEKVILLPLKSQLGFQPTLLLKVMVILLQLELISTLYLFK